MYEAIFSLIGVLLGSIITFLTTYLSECQKRKYEKKQEEKELICSVIKQYEIMDDKIWFNKYYNEDPMEIVKYISNEFMKIRRNRRDKELLFIRKKLLNKIEKIDSLVFPFDNPYDGKELMKIRSGIEECVEYLKKYVS